MLDEFVDAGIAEDLGEPSEGGVYHVLTYELSTVLVESVSNEHRDIIHPCVPRGSTKKYPVVVLSDLLESANPGSRTNKPLLIKYEEGTFYVLVLLDVVPAVNGKQTVESSVLRLSNTNTGGLSFPIFRVALLCGRDHI